MKPLALHQQSSVVITGWVIFHLATRSKSGLVLSWHSQYPRYGFKKQFKLFRNLGYTWNHKRVYRVYCGFKLNLRRGKGKKRLPSRHPEPLTLSAKAHDILAHGFY